MGVIGFLSVAVSAASAIAQHAQAKKAQRAQEEGNAIASAGQEIEDRARRRRALRDARIRQAMIEQSAVSSGASGSSGETGARSALQSNVATALAGQRAQVAVSQGVSAANQRAAAAQTKMQTIGAFSDVVTQGLDLWGKSQSGGV